MINLEKAKAFDDALVRLSESEGKLMAAQGKLYVAGLHEYNDRLIGLRNQIMDLSNEITKQFSKVISEEP